MQLLISAFSQFKNFKTFSLGIFIVCCSYGQVFAATPEPASLRSAPAGQLIGTLGRAGSYNWLGIPYATPPLGDLRWRAPLPAQPWSDTLQALTAASPCAQVSTTTQGVTLGSEDCLYLNIWTPPLTAAQIASGNVHLPVMVWVHGGANIIGDSASFNGGVLAATHNVIVVTTNYRLGLFGWFRSAALAASNVSAEDKSGNYGTLDIIEALRWTKANIAAFGGDPNNITIFGESAGASDVVSLLVVPAANTLFQRVISQSAVLETTSIAVAQNYKDDSAAPGADTSSGELLLRLLINDGQALERTTAKMVAATMTPSAIAAYLRSKTFVELNDAYTQLTPLQLTRPFIEIPPQLVRDGTVIPSGGISAAIRAGNYAHVPVMLGTNRDEYTALLSVVGIPTFLLPNPLTGQGLILDKPNYLLAAEYLTRLMKANSVDDLAAMLHVHQPGQVFTYRFDWDELLPSPMLDNIQMGATHGLEVPFVFQQLDLGPEFTRVISIMKPESMPSYLDLSDKMQSYWTQFARSGKPTKGGAGDLPLWNAWASAVNKSFMFVDEPAGGDLRMSTTVETRAQVLHALENDTRTGLTIFNRCGFAANLWSLRSGSRITKSEYANLFNGFCQLLMPLPNYNIQGDRDSTMSP